MSKQQRERRNTRTQNGPTPLASRGASQREASAFAGQLAAAQQANVSPSSRLDALRARIIPRGFMRTIQRLCKTLFNRRGRRRKLDIVDIQQLGDKRFVAVLRIGKQKFLIAGAAASVSLLAEIDARRVTPIAPRPLGQESA